VESGGGLRQSEFGTVILTVRGKVSSSRLNLALGFVMVCGFFRLATRRLLCGRKTLLAKGARAGDLF
jgi:hypothetical protein